jgi:hypothetical protein
LCKKSLSSNGDTSDEKSGSSSTSRVHRCVPIVRKTHTYQSKETISYFQYSVFNDIFQFLCLLNRWLQIQKQGISLQRSYNKLPIRIEKKKQMNKGYKRSKYMGMKRRISLSLAEQIIIQIDIRRIHIIIQIQIIQV